MWSFKRTRDIVSQRIIKWKARLNFCGGQQENRINFCDTYSPVVYWFSVRLLLILVLVNKWSTRQIDFVLTFLQSPLECDLLMKLPSGCSFEHGNTNNYFLNCACKEVASYLKKKNQKKTLMLDFFYLDIPTILQCFKYLNMQVKTIFMLRKKEIV